MRRRKGPVHADFDAAIDRLGDDLEAFLALLSEGKAQAVREAASDPMRGKRIRVRSVSPGVLSDLMAGVMTVNATADGFLQLKDDATRAEGLEPLGEHDPEMLARVLEQGPFKLAERITADELTALLSSRSRVVREAALWLLGRRPGTDR